MDSEKRKKTIQKIRNIGIIIVLMLFVIKLNKSLFFIVVFSILTYMGKYIRGMFGLKLVVLDPLLFAAIMMAKYIGYKEAIILVAINTLIVDFATSIASDGTFANFFLFSAGAVISVMIFGSLNVVVYASMGGLIYAIGYFLYRTFVPTQPKFEVLSKCFTSFLFTFLYASFFGPLLGLIMSV